MHPCSTNLLYQHLRLTGNKGCACRATYQSGHRDVGTKYWLAWLSDLRGIIQPQRPFQRLRRLRMATNTSLALDTDEGLELRYMQSQSPARSQMALSSGELRELSEDDEARHDNPHQGQGQQTPLLHEQPPLSPSPTPSPLPLQSSAQNIPNPLRTLSKGLTKREWKLKAFYICSLFLFGVASAISHHYFYRSRRNTLAANSQQQQWWNNIGVFFAGLTAAFLGAASTEAYYQYFWVIVRNLDLSLKEIDRLFSPSFTGFHLLLPRSFRFWQWRLDISTRWIAPACLMSFVCL